MDDHSLDIDRGIGSDGCCHVNVPEVAGSLIWA